MGLLYLSGSPDRPPVGGEVGFPVLPITKGTNSGSQRLVSQGRPQGELLKVDYWSLMELATLLDSASSLSSGWCQSTPHQRRVSMLVPPQLCPQTESPNCGVLAILSGGKWEQKTFKTL